MAWKRASLALAAGLLLVWTACKDQPSEDGFPSPMLDSEQGTESREDPFAIPDNPAPPTARWAQADELAADLEAARHPADGGGAAWIVDREGVRIERGRGVARTPGDWIVHYTAGELGVAVGGSIFFLPEPFWGWSAPQIRVPARLGYTEISTAAEGVELRTEDLGPMLRIEVAGRALAEGEVIRLHYGAGGSGALADVQAERGSRLWISVDGDGDGVRKVLTASPQIDVEPGPAAMLELLVRGAARVGDRTELVASVLDAFGNRCFPSGTLELANIPPGWDLPPTLPIEAGRATHSFVCKDEGIVRLTASAEIAGLTLEDEANPLWIGSGAPQILWADLHGHSGLSDGTGTPEDWYLYARDIALLDVVALTDHDHFGVLFIDQNPTLWTELKAANSAFHEPGRFVTVLGYEWTSWIHGHRHVLHFADEAPLRSSLDSDYDDPRKLTNALRGEDAMLMAHHTAGEPVATNWSFAPDPEVEPVVEILSVHGSSEARDAPRTVRGARDGYFVRDQLQRGLRFGFVGSGDSHDGHPGLPHLSPMYGARPGGPGLARELGTGGLAAIHCAERTRAAVLKSMRARLTYATSGPRVLLRTNLEGEPHGSSVQLSAYPSPPQLEIVAIADGRFERLDLITSWDGVRSQPIGERTFQGSLSLEGAEAGSWAYVRLLQADQGQVLSSPIFFE